MNEVDHKYPDSWDGTPEEWENLCYQCGRCCHANEHCDEATISSLGKVAACEFLTDDGTCSVYDDRFKKKQDCVTVLEGMKSESLPGGCAYEPYLGERSKPHYDVYTIAELKKVLCEQEEFVFDVCFEAILMEEDVDDIINSRIERIINRHKSPAQSV